MLREYEHHDTDGAIALYMETFANPPFCYTWLEYPRIRRYFEDMVNTPGFAGFVYEEDGAIVGLCVGQIQDYFACCAFEIKELLVSGGSRGRGIGSALLTDAEERLAARGVELMSLATSTDLAAFGFYERQGYQASGNTVWMGKAI